MCLFPLYFAEFMYKSPFPSQLVNNLGWQFWSLSLNFYVESSKCLLNFPKLYTMSLIRCLLLNILRVSQYMYVFTISFLYFSGQNNRGLCQERRFCQDWRLCQDRWEVLLGTTYVTRCESKMRPWPSLDGATCWTIPRRHQRQQFDPCGLIINHQVCSVRMKS